jgi:hypothetical protein
MKHRLTAVVLCSTLILAGRSAFADQPTTTTDQSQAAQGNLQDLGSIQLRLDKVEKGLDSLQKDVNAPKGPVQNAITDVKKLSKLTISGYAQIRYTQDQSSTLSKNSNTFDVKRARLKVVARPTANTAVTYEVDFGGVLGTAGGGNVSTKNAFIDYYFKGDPATGWTATAGQMLWPFGYQNVQSSSVRETPEYAIPISTLLPGQYDRGVKFATATGNRFFLESGVYNGIQTGDSSAANKTDDNYFKDIVGRARYKVASNLDAGVSWYDGESEKSTGSPIRLARDLYGMDIEYYLKSCTLKAEYIGGRADGYDKSGYWAQLTHNFTAKDEGVVMYDLYADPSNTTNGILTDWNVGYIRTLDKATKFKLFYDFRDEEKHSFNNNQFITEVVTIF